MGLLNKLPSSKLGLGGAKPNKFDVSPTGALHNEYSTIGKPGSVRWNSINGVQAIPQPSKLDISDSKSSFKPTHKYSDNKPK